MDYKAGYPPCAIITSLSARAPRHCYLGDDAQPEQAARTMCDGRFNRPATAESFVQGGFKADMVGDIFELSGHEFEARYQHIQQLVRAIALRECFSHP